MFDIQQLFIEMFVSCILLFVFVAKCENTINETLESRCHEYYKDDFVISAKLTPEECQLECFLLRSDAHGSHVFDGFEWKNHTLEDGTRCGDKRKCVNGSCERYYNKGTLYIVVNNVTLNDSFSQALYGSDIEIRIFLNGFFGVSKTLDDKKEIVFVDVDRNSLIRFDVSSSVKKKEVIASTTVSVINVVSGESRNRCWKMTPVTESEVILCSTIDWIENNSNNI